MTDGTTPPADPPADGMGGGAMGAAFALTAIFGSATSWINARTSLKIKQSQLNINKTLADSQFKRQMEGLFTAGRDMEEQSTQQHREATKAFEAKTAATRVMQAERGMEGASADENVKTIQRGSEATEQIIIKNFTKGQRSLAFSREGISDARSAQLAGFGMQDIAIQTGLDSPLLLAMGGAGADGYLDGYNTYLNMVANQGRPGTI